MGGLLALLLFAGFFYAMMRFGCGAHAVHGHGSGGGHGGHGGHSGHGEAPDRAQLAATGTDPVCGMNVPTDRGYTVTHAGHEFRLCSRSCLDKFEANPDRYATAKGGV